MTNSNADADKRTLVDGLRASRRAILDALNSIPPEHFADEALDGWSILDMLAHLSGWDFTNLKAMEEVRAGKLPGFYQYWDKDWRSYNALLINLYKRVDPAEQMAALHDSHARLVDFLETQPAADLLTDYGVQFKGEPVTIEGLIRSVTEDEHVHAAQIKDFASRTAR